MRRSVLCVLWFVLTMVLVVGSAVFAFDSAPGEGYIPTGKLVVYCAGSEDEVEVLTELWEERYPDCEIEFIVNGTGELAARIEAEAENPQGDVLLGGSYSVYAGLVDFLQPYVSPAKAECLPSYCGETDMYTPMQINVNMIIVNNEMISDLGIIVDGWESLTDEALKGNISYVDPSASSSAREQVINMLAAIAKKNNNTMDDNWDFVKKYFVNLDKKLQSSSLKVPQAVANGEYAVGITNEELILQLMRDGVDVSPVYAKKRITLQRDRKSVV